MKTTKYSNYNPNPEVLTELLGQLMRSGGGGRSSNGYSSRRRGEGGGRSSGRGPSRSRGIRRSTARASSRLPPRGSIRSAKPRSTAADSSTRRSNGTSAGSTNASSGRKRSAAESGGPEKKKSATEGKGEDADKGKSNDDTYTKGLSELGMRWYNRYLKEGLEPKAAAKKAWEHYTEPAEFEPQWGKELSIKEGEEDKVHFLTRVRRKKRPVINEDLRIAVHPKDFPDQMLNLPTVMALEVAIMAEVAKWDNEKKLKFTYAHLRPGAVLVDCVDEFTANWLKETVSSKLSTWEGPELTTSVERSIPDAYVMSIVLPKSIGQEFERTLTLIAAQNEDLNTEVWKLVNEREENEKQVVTIRVDKDSFNTIKRNDWKIYYRFEKVGVHFHRYLRYNTSPVLWITNPSCHKQNQVKPPGPTSTK